jgi:hypothetical protein
LRVDDGGRRQRDAGHGGGLLMSGRRNLGAFARLAALAAAAFTGCFSDPTEVVVVVDTDATSRDFVQMQFMTTPGVARPDLLEMPFLAVADATPLPVTLGLTPAAGRTSSTFDVIVEFITAGAAGGSGELPFLHRRVSNISFVPEQIMTVFIPLFRFCSSNGTTSFPHAQDDECRDITAPVLTKFDEDNIPHLSKPVAATP